MIPMLLLIAQAYTVPAIGLPRALVDSQGTPVMYVNKATFYTWSGTPVAYYGDENIYRFDGKHLGWYHDGRVCDHEGRIVLVVASLSEYPRASIPVSQGDALPEKARRDKAPAPPEFVSAWSKLSVSEWLRTSR